MCLNIVNNHVKISHREAIAGKISEMQNVFCVTQHQFKLLAENDVLLLGTSVFDICMLAGQAVGTEGKVSKNWTLLHTDTQTDTHSHTHTHTHRHTDTHTHTDSHPHTQTQIRMRVKMDTKQNHA